LIHIVENNLIKLHIKDILSKGFGILLNENRYASVALIYDLFLRIGQVGINDLREAFGNYIKTHGRALVIDVDKDDKMVDELLEFKEKLDCFLHECFHNNEKFSNTLKDSFEHFINQRTNKPGELIGLYC
jgi:cullin-4